ncbi:LamG-like jellyroll fold domain-containing protein [Streptomyces sp. NPDC052051]|uniref:LamG-like jellyroll fold domain-containing protein n=1 Tax=Streptomyces sp. NPDC052051 TaxID=3154649 RepID=UPI00343D4437
MAALLTAVVLLGPMPSPAQAAPAAGPTAASGTSPEQSEAARALAKAEETGERVEVTGERSEEATVYANPDGSTMTLEESAVPVRVRTGDGGWRAPDATLARRADGTVAPKAAAVGMEFSGGGSKDPLVRIDDHGRSLELGWPGALPQPEVDGTTAVYRDVLPEVDLNVIASTEGFRTVLVIRTPEAAAQPELQRIDYSLRTSGLSVVENNSGGFNAVDHNGNWVFRTPRAQMWDSAGSSGTAESAAGNAKHAAALSGASADDESARSPGSEPAPGDTVKPMKVTADDDSLTVVPDSGMLTDTRAEHFPLYIDPPVSWGEAERTLLRSDGYESYGWGNGSDNRGEGVGKCGSWNGYYCGPGYTQRLYFEFAPDKLKGKHVLDATFRVTEPWAFQCSPRWVQLYRTNNISASTTWASRPANLDLLGDRNVSAGRGSTCDPDTPAAPIEFNDDPNESYENLTPTVSSFAAGKFSRLTLMLKAKDETDPSAWKRFRNDATLAVKFVAVPDVPTSPLAAGSCETTESDPAWISDPTPSFSARPQTAAGGESGAQLKAHFYVQQKTSSGWSVVATEPIRPSSGYVGDNAVVTVDSPVTLAQNTPYRMAVFSRSYPDSGSALESHSTVTTKGWCYFEIDSTRPKAPTVTTPSGALYTVCPDGGDGCGAATGGPGLAGQFTFTKNSADNNIAAFEYKLATDKAWTKVSATGSVTRSVKPALSGVQVLSVRAVDSVGTGQAGETAAVRFNVAEGEGPSGLWHFDDASAGSATTTAKDTGTAPGTRHNLTLRESGAGWSTFSRTGDGGRSLWLNDTADSSAQTGYAETSGPVVNTQSSFTVSAWAYPADSTAFRTVLSQTGSDNRGFELYYSPGSGKWVFLTHWYDSTGARKYIGANADATPGITLKAWTHLAGVYDADAHTLSLFVNGRRQGAPVPVPQEGWATAVNGNFQIGRAGTTSGSYNNYWKGRVDEVAAYQTALPDAEVAKVAKLLTPDGTARAVEMVAAWQPQGSTGTAALADPLTPYGRGLQLNSGAKVTDGAIVLDGVDDSVTTPGPVIDDRESFTVTTEVELDAAAVASKADGYSAQILGQRTADGSAWGLWYQRTGSEEYVDEESGELRTRPVGFWRFGRLGADGSFTAVDSDEAASDGAVRLTGVYDAQEGTISLYLDATRNGVDTPYTAVIGSGDLAGGKGFVNKTWGHYLPGRITDIRIWAGAAGSSDQVARMVGATQDAAGDEVTG